MKFSFTCMNTYTDAQALSRNFTATPRRLWDPEKGKQTGETAMQLSAVADEAGFDYVSVSEHHYQAGMCNPNPAVIAGALTRVVKRAGIALLGPLVSMNNPVRIAEELAMLDQLSGGRLIAMPLRGTPNEFANYNIDPAETRARTEEGMLLIKKALSEPEPFAWKSEYFDYPIVSVWPGPTQLPHMPLFYSANSPESGTFAAQHGFGGGCSYFGVDRVAELLGHYRAEARAAGWEPAPEQTLYRAFCVVGEDETHAADLVERFYGRPEDRAAVPAAPSGPPASAVPAAGSAEQKKNAGMGFGMLQFSGDPAGVVEQLREFQAKTGVGMLDLAFNFGHYSVEETVDQIRRFAAEVMPKVRDLDAVPA
jgi:alkanesulfonate monooxygenase SsuD/methylene tetrahydromethanopterin reductase-like flavin-dependent oxidoreductase (luciferase family)